MFCIHCGTNKGNDTIKWPYMSQCLHAVCLTILQPATRRKKALASFLWILMLTIFDHPRKDSDGAVWSNVFRPPHKRQCVVFHSNISVEALNRPSSENTHLLFNRPRNETGRFRSRGQSPRSRASSFHSIWNRPVNSGDPSCWFSHFHVFVCCENTSPNLFEVLAPAVVFCSRLSLH